MAERVVGRRQAGGRRNGAASGRRRYRGGHRLPQVLNSYEIQATVAVVQIDHHNMPYVQQIQRCNRLVGGLKVAAPKPRLRWSRELHEAFVKACNQLGGANKATPKALMNLIKADGVSLHHLKSHLQKFRMGKIGRRLWTAEHCYAGFQQVAMEGHGSSDSNRSDENESTYECVTNTYAGDSFQDLQVFFLAAEEKMKANSSVKMVFPFVEGLGDIEIDGTHLDWCHWSELLDGGGRQPSFPCPIDDKLMEDYLKSLDESSDSASFTSTIESGGSFSKMDDDDLAGESGMAEEP